MSVQKCQFLALFTNVDLITLAPNINCKKLVKIFSKRTLFFVVWCWRKKNLLLSLLFSLSSFVLMLMMCCQYVSWDVSMRTVGSSKNLVGQYHYLQVLNTIIYWPTLCCKCLGSFAFLWCKMPMFWRAGMREGGKPLPLAFQYLIFMV